MDDRWRDSYDAWKLAIPPEYEISPEEEDRLYDYDAELDWESLLETYR
jgi:hypothetical protein